MRKIVRHSTVLVVTIWLAVGNVWAQQAGPGQIKELKEQVRRLAEIESDPEMPDDVKARNRGFLQSRRDELRSALKKRQGALRRYLAATGTALKADESRVIEDELSIIEQSLRELDPAAERAAQEAAPRRPAPAERIQIASADPVVALSSASSDVPVFDSLAAERARRADAEVAGYSGASQGCRVTIMDAPEGGKFVAPEDLQTYKLRIKVEPPRCAKKLYVEVKNRKNDASPEIVVFNRTEDANRNGVQEVSVKFGEGINTVSVYDTANRSNYASLELACIGEDCGKASGEAAKAEEFSPLTAYSRAVAGIDRAGASSADAEQKFFIEYSTRVPLARLYRGEGDNPNNAVNSRVWAWLSPRISSLPQQTGIPVGDITAAGAFVNPILEGKAGDIAQAFEFLGGLEVALLKSRDTRAIPAGYKDTRIRFGLSLIGGAGIITPLSPGQDTRPIFRVNPTITARFPDAEGKEFIAFVAQDRSRFFRQYYGGLRLVSQFYTVKKDGSEVPASRFPGMLDVTFGQNESVTRGCLCGGVMRIEGFYPIPFVESFHVFGTVLTKLTKPKVLPPLILQTPDDPPSIIADNVLIQPLDTIDRDFYRLGIGIDLIQLIKKAKKDDKKEQ